MTLQEMEDVLKQCGIANADDVFSRLLNEFFIQKSNRVFLRSERGVPMEMNTMRNKLVKEAFKVLEDSHGDV